MALVPVELSAAFADVGAGGYAGADGDGAPDACTATVGLHRSDQLCLRIDCRVRGAANRLDRLLKFGMLETISTRKS